MLFSQIYIFLNKLKPSSVERYGQDRAESFALNPDSQLLAVLEDIQHLGHFEFALVISFLVRNRFLTRNEMFHLV